MSHLNKPQLSLGQFQLVAKSYHVTSSKALLDVGCGDNTFANKIGADRVRGLDDAFSGKSTDLISYGSPAASIPFDVQTCKCALVRGTETFYGATHPMEVTIALANILSCITVKGSLVIPIDSAEEKAEWVERLSCFPVTLEEKTLSTGLFGKLSFGLLTGGMHSLKVLDFKLGRKPISRLEWHRYAREGVLASQNSPAAA